MGVRLRSSWSIHTILILGSLLRLVALCLASNLPLRGAPFFYHRMALQLMHKEGFQPFWPPGLPYYLGLFYSWFGESELVGRACMIVLYWLSSLSLFLLTREISNSQVANVAVLIFSIFPTFVYHSVTPLTQLPMAAVLTAITYLAIRSRESTSWVSSISLGLLLGIGALIRPSAFLLVLFLPLYFIISKRKLLWSSTIVMIGMLVVFLWIFKVYRMTGELVMVNHANSMNFFFGNSQWTPAYKTWFLGSHASESEGFRALMEEIKGNPLPVQDRLYMQHAIDYIISRPDMFLLRTFNRVKSYFAFDTYVGAVLIKDYGIIKMVGLSVIVVDAICYLCIIVLAILFFFLPSQIIGNRSVKYYFIGIIVVYAFPYWLSFAHPTYHFPVVPILGSLAAVTGTKLLNEPRSVWESITSSKRKRYLAALCMILFIYVQVEYVVLMYSSI